MWKRKKRKSNDIKKLKNTENHKQFCGGGGWCGDEKIRRKKIPRWGRRREWSSWFRSGAVTGNRFESRVMLQPLVHHPETKFTSIFSRHMNRGKLNSQKFPCSHSQDEKPSKKLFLENWLNHEELSWRLFNINPVPLCPLFSHPPLPPRNHFPCMFFHPQIRKNSSRWKLRNQFKNFPPLRQHTHRHPPTRSLKIHQSSFISIL